MNTTDETIRQNLVGTWIAPSGSKWRFNNNGSWSHDEPQSSFSGTWQVADAELSMTITNYSGRTRSRSPVGGVLHCTVVRVNDKELVEDLGETTVTLQRADARTVERTGGSRLAQ